MHNEEVPSHCSAAAARRQMRWLWHVWGPANAMLRFWGVVQCWWGTHVVLLFGKKMNHRCCCCCCCCFCVASSRALQALHAAICRMQASSAGPARGNHGNFAIGAALSRRCWVASSRYVASLLLLLLRRRVVSRATKVLHQHVVAASHLCRLHVAVGFA